MNYSDSDLENSWKHVTQNFDLTLFENKKINPDNLLKHELIFELQSLGVDETVIQNLRTVDPLRAKYRETINMNPTIIHVTVQLDQLVKYYDTYSRKITSLIQRITEMEKTDLPTANVVRSTESQILHYLNTLTHMHLTAVKQNNQNLLSDIDITVTKLQALATQVYDWRQKHVHSDVSRQAQGNVNENKQDKIQPTIFNFDQLEIESELSQRNEMQNGNVACNRLATTANIYSPLDNPIKTILKQCKPTNGLDYNDLLKYLQILLDIQKSTPISDNDLMRVIIPYTELPLLNQLLQAIQSNTNFHTFHKRIINYFIPDRLLSNLQRERYYRLQAPNEQLSNYITRIKESAKLLLLDHNETEITQNILTGLNPDERNRLTFLNKPTNFQELDLMCVQAHNTKYDDNQRNKLYNQFQSNYHNKKPQNNTNSQNHSQHYTTQNRIVCFKCGKPNHKANVCRSKNLDTASLKPKR
jgi:hypothetical protein